MNQTKRANLDHLEAQRKIINDEFDTLCYRQECGIEIDTNRWYQLIAQSNQVEERIGLLMAENAIDRCDAIIDDLRHLVALSDPFEPGDSLPEVIEEYDPWMEQKQTESELRRGEG